MINPAASGLRPPQLFCPICVARPAPPPAACFHLRRCRSQGRPASSPKTKNTKTQYSTVGALSCSPTTTHPPRLSEEKEKEAALLEMTSTLLPGLLNSREASGQLGQFPEQVRVHDSQSQCNPPPTQAHTHTHTPFPPVPWHPLWPFKKKTPFMNYQ